jgi:hypothetical protein
MFKPWCILALLVWCAAWARAGEVLDAIAATVNAHVILRSDVDDELRFESLASGKERASYDAQQERDALGRLIDQELLREQMHSADLDAITADQVARQISSLREACAKGHPLASWEETLRTFGLNEKVVEDRVRSELQQLQFIDARFRPLVQVLPDEIEQYYKNQLVPGLPASDPVSISEATPKIREILIQHKMNDMLSSWLDTLRSQAQIRIFAIGSDSGSPQVGPR